MPGTVSLYMPALSTVTVTTLCSTYYDLYTTDGKGPLQSLFAQGYTAVEW